GWEGAVASSGRRCATIQDYDWADEVLHARIGREWYVSQFENSKDALNYGDECWTKVMLDWNSFQEKGLTQHRNWWPDLYREACARSGATPDPLVLAFNESYESK